MKLQRYKIKYKKSFFKVIKSEGILYFNSVGYGEKVSSKYKRIAIKNLKAGKRFVIFKQWHLEQQNYYHPSSGLMTKQELKTRYKKFLFDASFESHLND